MEDSVPLYLQVDISPLLDLQLDISVPPELQVDDLKLLFVIFHLNKILLNCKISLILHKTSISLITHRD